jgi:hypothetical protein
MKEDDWFALAGVDVMQPLAVDLSELVSHLEPVREPRNGRLGWILAVLHGPKFYVTVAPMSGKFRTSLPCSDRHRRPRPGYGGVAHRARSAGVPVPRYAGVFRDQAARWVWAAGLGLLPKRRHLLCRGRT